MKTLSALALISGCVAFAACAADPQEASAPQELRNRVDADTASTVVAKAECERERRCHRIGATERYQNTDHCMHTEKRTVDQDFGSDSDCKNGVATEDLDECIAQINAEDCGGIGMALDEMRKSMKCGSNDLCLD